MPSLDIIIPAFNAAHCLQATLEAVFGQTAVEELAVGVVVVNNRSTDQTGELIELWADKGVRRVDHAASQGRSSTINAGVAASSADYVLVLDADCVLVGHDCLTLLAQAMRENIDAGFGYATSDSKDFWGRYKQSLATHRMRAGWQGWTTPCCLIRQSLFVAVAGFPLDYRYYGFEDRDFVCKLRSHEYPTKLRSLPDLRVSHDDDASAIDVFEKMYISGRHSSGIFRRNHPQEYRDTVYSRTDVDTASKPMALTLRFLQPFRPLLSGAAAVLSRRKHTPLLVGGPLVKLCSALSYFQGTVDRNKDK